MAGTEGFGDSGGRDIHEFAYLEDRKLWHINSFDIVDEPIIKSLVTYRRGNDRYEVESDANGVSSKTVSGKHKPIIDLDFAHQYVSSASDGHAHLYLNVPISYFRWFVLMCALRFAKVIEPGYFLWSLRRGHNQVRYPNVLKLESEKGEYTHGWFFKQKKDKASK